MKIFAWIATSLICAVETRYYLHMLQLESYQLDGYVRWLKKNQERLLSWTLSIGVGATAAWYLLWFFMRVPMKGDAAGTWATVITLVGFAAAAFALDRGQHKLPEKKPLVFTPRMRRLCLATLGLSLAGGAILNLLSIPPYVLFVATPYIALASGAIMAPHERAVNDRFLNEAKAMLAARPELIKIGITGSYGKTSTKFILATILSEKFSVLASPASFNTPMGLTRCIRERLAPEHQVFIAEMGARHTGDIKELTDLVAPRYGVLTSVGEQHLETFGSIENVAEGKYELIASLPSDGAAFFAADGGWADALFERCPVEKYRAGLRGAPLDVRASDIKTTPDGSSFSLHTLSGETIDCQTRLLGRHNIQNIVLCCAVALKLGLTLEEIARGVRKVEPVEHRLQLIRGTGGVTVIDDAFNSNPAGAKAALDVLREFPGRRVIVTPGMVELGEREEELNRAFGAQIAASCDAAILVGKKRTIPIFEGARTAGMAENALRAVSNLDEATALLARMGRAGDVVLFENDLPDNYNEA